MALPGANNGFLQQFLTQASPNSIAGSVVTHSPVSLMGQLFQPANTPSAPPSVPPGASPSEDILQTYNPQSFMGFTIPGEQPGQQSNTINLNTVDMSGIDGLIGRYGPAPDLLKRREFLLAQQNKNAQNPMTTEEQIQAEALKRSNAGLQTRMDEIFADQAKYGTQAINDQYADPRRRAISEEAAAGRLRSPVSASWNAPINNVDRLKSQAMNQLFGNIAGQRASGQLDIAKTIEGLLAGERRAGEQVSQFGQSLGNDQSKQRYQQLQDTTANSQFADKMNLTSRLNQPDVDPFDLQYKRINGGLDLFNNAKKTGGNIAALFA